MTLFEEIKAKGIPYRNHGSYLYVYDTPGIRDMVNRHRRIFNAFTFNDGSGDHEGLEILFAYDPFWQTDLLEA